MFLHCARVLMGLAIARFHAPLADFVREQDRALADAMRLRGVVIPGALPEGVSRDLFFLLGIAAALLSLSRMWFALH